MLTVLALIHANLPALLALVGFFAAKLHTKLTAASPAAQQAAGDGAAVAKALVDALQQSVPAPK